MSKPGRVAQCLEHALSKAKLPVMKLATPDSSAKRRIKPKPVDGLAFVELRDETAPITDSDQRLAAFYAKYPLRRLRRTEKGIVESLREDRDRR